MSKKWPVQDAKSRFSELLDTTVAEGPQDCDQARGGDRSAPSHRAVAKA